MATTAVAAAACAAAAAVCAQVQQVCCWVLATCMWCWVHVVLGAGNVHVLLGAGNVHVERMALLKKDKVRMPSTAACRRVG